MNAAMDIEIVGLSSNTNGRSCTLHAVCGDAVEVGDVLRLVPCVVTINHETEEAIKVVKVVDGVDTCTVAFVPRVQSSLPGVKGHTYKFVQVIELYSKSDSPYKRSKSQSNRGMARVSLLDPEEGRNE